MKFGHTDISQPDFKLMDEPKFWFQSSANQCNIYFGSTNWTETYWKEVLYPPKTKSQDFLYYHSRFFTTIELNTTFYRNPSSDQVIKWKNSTPCSFKFCPKVPSRISQSRLLGTDTVLWKEFEDSMFHFDTQLGPSFLQLPEYFDSSKNNILEKLILEDHIHHTLLVELRHESWFSNTNIFHKLCSTLSSKKMGLVITDTPGRQDVLHSQICCTKLLIRFVSNGNPIHDHQRIDQWSSQLEKLRKNGMSELHFIFHHPDALQMVELTKLMQKRHNKS